MTKLKYDHKTGKILKYTKTSPWWKFWNKEYKITNFKNN